MNVDTEGGFLEGNEDLSDMSPIDVDGDTETRQVHPDNLLDNPKSPSLV